MNNETVTKLELEIGFIRQYPELLKKLEKFSTKLIKEWWEQYERILKLRKEGMKKQLEEGKRYHELILSKQKAPTEENKKRSIEARAARLDRYCRMGFMTLVEEYLNHYYRVKIAGTSIVPVEEGETINIIENEVKESRNKAEQAIFDGKLNQLKEAKCPADLKALGIKYIK
jgi:hypothetical protein